MHSLCGLLYFDLTKCAEISPGDGACPSTQICVENCPGTYCTSAQGKTSGLEVFCNNVISAMMGDNITSISQLVEERRCTAYILPSTSVMGRCLPVLAWMGTEEGEVVRAEDKMAAIKTEEGEGLQVDKLLGGIKFVLDSIDGCGYCQKLFVYLSTYWWTILVFLILSSFLSLIILVLIRQAARPVLWIIILPCPAILLALPVSSLVRYSKPRTVSEGNNFTSMSSYWFDKNTWLISGGIMCAVTFITFLIC
jgi:hypothetical protein